MNAILAAAFLALTVSGCQEKSMREFGDIAVGEAMPFEMAPIVPESFLMGWLCNGQTIIANGQSMPDECKSLEIYTILYRDSTWQYAVEVRHGVVASISKYRLDAWP